MLNDIYQDDKFKTFLSLFGWMENVLYKEHIVHCSMYAYIYVIMRLDCYWHLWLHGREMVDGLDGYPI